MVGIYKITSPSGRVYIGQSRMIEHRFRRYRKCSDRMSGQRMLYASLLKYGSYNHIYEIVCELPSDVSRNILDNYEEFIISQLKEGGIKLLNLTGGGLSNKELSEETREKLRQSATGKKYWLGRKHTQETKDKIRKGNTGKIFTAERLAKMSAGNIGKPSPMLGKKVSDETKAKISAAHKGKKLSPEHKEKVVASLRIIHQKKRNHEH